MTDDARLTPDPSSAGEVQARAMNYLAHGGLFNPESMDHAAVSNLVCDLLARVEALERDQERTVFLLKLACDRTWTDEKPHQVVTVAINALHWAKERAEAAEATVKELRQAIASWQAEEQLWKETDADWRSQVHALTAQLKQKDEELARMVSQRHGVPADVATASPNEKAASK